MTDRSISRTLEPATVSFRILAIIHLQPDAVKKSGLGARRVWRVLGHEAHAAVCCERTITPPFGLAGGRAGAPMQLWLELPDGTVRRLNSKGSFRAPAGARLVMEAPGSGGYGPPSFRDDALVREDRANGYVTGKAMHRDYGLADL